MDRDLLKKVIEDCGVTFYDSEVVSENGESIFRVYIYDKEGITLDKCVEVTNIISPILDVEPPIGGEYRLEVSSPGIERKLTKLEHFKHSIGDLVKLKLSIDDYAKIDGKIADVEGDIIKIEDTDGNIRDIDFNDILKAKTYYKW
jgi:ribosome maturation factor RimP